MEVLFSAVIPPNLLVTFFNSIILFIVYNYTGPKLKGPVYLIYLNPASARALTAL